MNKDELMCQGSGNILVFEPRVFRRECSGRNGKHTPSFGTKNGSKNRSKIYFYFELFIYISIL